MSDTSHAELRREIDQLGRLFGEVIKHHGGESDLGLVEQVRGLARRLHEGDEESGAALRDLLSRLDLRQLTIVIRSFTIFLELANLAEDRQRIRVLRERERGAYPEPRQESVRAAFADFHRRGLSTEAVQQIIHRVHVELVFTAHPTEAKRRTVRRILRRIRQCLANGDRQDLLPRERERVVDELRGELHKLWQTDFVRPWRPTVLQEVERGLAIMPVVWSEAPALLDELREAVRECYPKVQLPARPLVQFGSWIGGDRDGNPFVTTEVSARTLALLRHHAVSTHRATARRLARSLSMSDRLAEQPELLERAIDRATQKWPAVAGVLDKLPPLETYRRWMRVIDWRLEQTLEETIGAARAADNGGYHQATELAADVQIVADSLNASDDELIVQNEVQPWLDQIQVFGLKSARLDIRQHSEAYHQAIDEMWRVAGLCDHPDDLDEAAREALLIDTLASPELPALDGDLAERLSETTRETLTLFALLRRTARQYGMPPLGAHVLSMTHTASDVLTMLWLWRWSERTDGGAPGDEDLRLPAAPLFETIDDLDHAAATLRVVFSTPVYREYVRAQGDQQLVMIGYSDSTKDGGYVAAQWALQQSQIEMQKVADEFGIRITFFHGRGGSLGRGGGPTARSILSLPKEAYSGSLRLTEQGEVLADRYDTPEIAFRHLEQVCWSSLIATARKSEAPPAAWTQWMQTLAERSLAAYRQLVDAPGFADYYRAVTPINVIERLPMGSRPSKRKAGHRIEDLRAIPWVFSWTQCRALLPAWYGLGSAVEGLLDDPDALATLRAMHREWPFFRAMIENAELALAKANMPVFRMYATLGAEIDGAGPLTAAIVDEHARASRGICAITESQKLLDGVPWLQRSIQVRNGYVDPLNVVQVVVLEQLARDPAAHALAAPDDLEHLASIAINGISAGMRTTG